VTEAILLVGGFGTRLRPLTERVPKPLLPVGGVPFVHHQLTRARAAGVDHVVLATSYQAEAFAAGLGDGSRLGISVDYSVEDEPLGTGGAIRHAAKLLTSSGPDDPVLVFNGDVLDGHDLPGQLALHRERDADVTLYLTVVDDARAYGCVPVDTDGRVAAFLEKMAEPVTNRVNAGCYAFRRSVIDEIPADRPVSVERETFPGLLAARRRVFGCVDRAYWVDLGTPAAYVRGSADLVLGRVSSPARPGWPGEFLILDGADVAPTATLRAGTSVLPGATVGDGAVVDGSVVMAGATVGAGCIVRGSAVGTGASLGEDCVLVDAVVGDGARLGARNELRFGARVACDLSIPDGGVRFS
jgi:mannose-1-phosphate guanylyltransferase